ncbi:MAG: sugar phosphate isomerase/epimerase [Armatimonadetes bacterium]|nr:sugar phosphate isomerase/epimerase [Armatimonadota bacterium]
MKTALHTISYAGIWPGQASLSLSDTIRRAADLGFDAVMIAAKRPHLSILDTDDGALARLRGELDAAGVGVACLAGYNNFSGDADHPDIPHHEFQIAYIERMAQMTAALGGSIVRVFTAYGHPALPEGALRQRVVSCLKEAAQRAAPYGCTLAVQNHHDFAAHWQTLRDVLEEIDEPNCRAGFDAWAPTLHGDDIVAAAREMAPLTAQTVVADYVLRPRFKYHPPLVAYEPQLPLTQAVPMGEGMIDYRGFLNALADAGYDGTVIYEMCSPLLGGGSLENLDAYARKFLEFMGTL